MSSVVLTITLPTTRSDASAATPADVASITVNRDVGAGPVLLTTIAGPFTALTATFNDASPVAGSDSYTAFCTDQAGTVGETSSSATVSITAPLAALSAPTITAVVGP